MNKSGGSDLLLACSVGDLAWLKRGLPTGEVSVTKTRNPEVSPKEYRHTHFVWPCTDDYITLIKHVGSYLSSPHCKEWPFRVYEVLTGQLL